VYSQNSTSYSAAFLFACGANAHTWPGRGNESWGRNRSHKIGFVINVKACFESLYSSVEGFIFSCQVVDVQLCSPIG